MPGESTSTKPKTWGTRSQVQFRELYPTVNSNVIPESYLIKNQEAYDLKYPRKTPGGKEIAFSPTTKKVQQEKIRKLYHQTKKGFSTDDIKKLSFAYKVLRDELLKKSVTKQSEKGKYILARLEIIDKILRENGPKKVPEPTVVPTPRPRLPPRQLDIKDPRQIFDPTSPSAYSRVPPKSPKKTIQDLQRQRDEFLTNAGWTGALPSPKPKTPTTKPTKPRPNPLNIGHNKSTNTFPNAPNFGEGYLSPQAEKKLRTGFKLAPSNVKRPSLESISPVQPTGFWNTFGSPKPYNVIPDKNPHASMTTGVWNRIFSPKSARKTVRFQQQGTQLTQFIPRRKY